MLTDILSPRFVLWISVYLHDWKMSHIDPLQRADGVLKPNQANNIRQMH